MKLLFILLTAICQNTIVCEHANIKHHYRICPTWTHPNESSSQHECICGDSLKHTVKCDPTTLDVYLSPLYCISYDEDLNNTVIGNCPYGQFPVKTLMVPKERSALTSFQCGSKNRRGQLCGQCEENYTLPLYSYNLKCFKCNHSHYGWIKYIAAAFLPLTVFYVLVIVFRISATSSKLNGFVLVSQLYATPAIVRKIYTTSLHSIRINYASQYLTDLAIAVYAVWNLDFFRSFYSSVCVHQSLTIYHVLILDYAVAVYPILLIFVTFIFVKLHDNFAIVVSIWRPFHKCLAHFRKQYNIRSSLVSAFATFIVLSYIKILNVSFDLLSPSTLYSEEGQKISKTYLYYDATVDMTSKEYLPYLSLAIIMLLVFNILPLLLLTVYPFQFFQKLLNHSCLKPIHRLALQVFMDSFHGCFKDDAAHDYRHFASIYLALRFVHPLLFILLNYGLYLPIASFLIIIVMVLIVKYQPYKCKNSNLVDTILLLVLISGSLAQTLSLMIESLRQKLLFPIHPVRIIEAILSLVPPGYGLLLLVTRIVPSNCYRRAKRFVLQCIKRDSMDSITSEEQVLQAELTTSGGPNYHTFQDTC